MAFDEQKAVQSPSGALLKLRVKRCRSPRAILQLNHGLAEHSARYGRFAAVMAESGVVTYAHDHRGHGFTNAPQAPRGSFGPQPAVELVLADVLALHDLVAQEHPGLPVIVFGHSMGGLIALNFAMAHAPRLAGAAIWNAPRSAGPAGRLARIALAWERIRLGSDVPSRILPRVTFRDWGRRFSETGTGLDWLSRDEDEVRRYAEDPLSGWDPSVGMWRAIFEMGFRADSDRNLAAMPRTLPFNLVGGSDDPVTAGGADVRRLSRRLAALKFTNLETTIYPHTRHESLNELNGDLVTSHFAGWIESRIVAGR